MLERMSDLPPDLDRLRTLETYLRLQLDAVRAAIHRAEQDAPPVGDRSPRALAAAERQRRADAVPSDDSIRWWKLAPGRPATLHRGDCTTAGTGPTITRSMARAALTDERDGAATAVACGHCRPDIGL
jgi:hypothetical protein